MYARTTYVRTWMPAIHAARRLAPTVWKRRPGVDDRSITETTSVRTTTAQNALLTPNTLSITTSASESGHRRVVGDAETVLGR